MRTMNVRRWIPGVLLAAGGLAVVLGSPRAALAVGGAECSSNYSGICVSVALCQGQNKQDNGPSDCNSDPNDVSKTCCKVLQQAPPPAPTPVTCEAQGGSCQDVCMPDQDPIGILSCPSTQFCCKSRAVAPPSPPPSGTTGDAAKAQGASSQSGSPDRLVLPPCTKTGNCSLADIVQAGINFATFIMGLSAALFFAVFVYGGAMYLLSFGDKKRVEKGKAAIKGAAIGMIFVLGAWTIVQTLVKGISGTTGGTPAASQCTSQGQGYACTTLIGNTGQQALADGESKGLSCKTGLCPGPVNVLCCKPK